MRRTLYTFVQNILFPFLAALCTQLAFAEYKPVDVSDITGEQRKDLMKVRKEIASMPILTRDLFFCEQLGLLFKKDGSKAMSDYYNGCHYASGGDFYPVAYGDSYFVGRTGRPEVRQSAIGPHWGGGLFGVMRFKKDATFAFFKREVELVVLSTAKYLLKELPDEERWMLLASMGNMLYNEQKTSFSARQNCRMDCGITHTCTKDEGRGYSYLDPSGKAQKVDLVIGPRNSEKASKYWRWRQIVWRCENLVGAKDILAIFPDEVKAMRKAYKQRLAGIAKKAEEAKTEQEARNEALVNAADEALKELDPEQRRAWLAEHFGFCYTGDGRPAFQSERTANDDALFVDADGKERKLSDVANKSDEKWIAATNAAIIVKYSKQFMARRKDELEDLACRTAYTVLASMPADLRQSWLAERNYFFFLPDLKYPYGNPGNWTLESGVKITPTPVGTGWDYGKCLYYDPIGKIAHSVSVSSAWDKRWRLLYYCESLIGLEAINSFFSDEVNAMRKHFEKSPFHKK